jgi:hypothetical protein
VLHLGCAKGKNDDEDCHPFDLRSGQAVPRNDKIRCSLNTSTLLSIDMLRINIEEATGTCYIERNSLSLAFYTGDITIVGSEK